MTLLEYNLKNNVLLLGVCLFGMSWLSCTISKAIILHVNVEDEKHMVNLCKIIISIVFMVLYIISCCYFVESNEHTNTAVVEEHVKMGSIGDLIITHSIWIVDNEGNRTMYSTPIFANKKLLKELDCMQEGDRVFIKYTKNFPCIYYLEITE